MVNSTDKTMTNTRDCLKLTTEAQRMAIKKIIEKRYCYENFKYNQKWFLTVGEQTSSIFNSFKIVVPKIKQNLTKQKSIQKQEICTGSDLSSSQDFIVCICSNVSEQICVYDNLGLSTEIKLKSK